MLTSNVLTNNAALNNILPNNLFTNNVADLNNTLQLYNVAIHLTNRCPPLISPYCLTEALLFRLMYLHGTLKLCIQICVEQ